MLIIIITHHETSGFPESKEGEIFDRMWCVKGACVVGGGGLGFENGVSLWSFLRIVYYRSYFYIYIRVDSSVVWIGVGWFFYYDKRAGRNVRGGGLGRSDYKRWRVVRMGTGRICGLLGYFDYLGDCSEKSVQVWRFRF